MVEPGCGLPGPPPPGYPGWVDVGRTPLGFFNLPALELLRRLMCLEFRPPPPHRRGKNPDDCWFLPTDRSVPGPGPATAPLPDPFAEDSSPDQGRPQGRGHPTVGAQPP